MPYDRLPARLRQLIPSEKGQEIFRNVVNSQLKAGRSESVAFASAWSRLEDSGYKKNTATGKWEKLEKASGAKPLYMKRKILNAEKIVGWAKAQGVATTLEPDQMHVTVIYSKEPFSREYTQMAEQEDEAPMYYGNHVVRGGKRSVERLGENGEALVLKIECPRLASEHYGFRAMGASSDWPDYKPHITISWNAENVDESSIEPFDGDIVMSDVYVSLLDEDWKSTITEKSQPTNSSVHVPSTELDKEESFKPPASARNNARRVLRWKEKYGDEVKGMTQVGWTRANQLASGENLSRKTVARMSAFARHRKNADVDPKYKSEPWKDRGYVAWLGWGGTSGINWANAKMDSIEKRQVEDDMFSEPSEAAVRSMDLGLEGEIHVHERDGQAVYMPGSDHEEYLERVREMAGIPEEEEGDSEPVKEGLLERTISAIIGAIMQQVSVNKSTVEAKVLKMDDEQRVVYGWASVVTEDGKPVIDTQGDVISPSEMEKMANDFMLDVRKAKAMHEGDQIGEVIHSMPLTEELMKSFDIYSDREGWLIAMKIHDDKTWADMREGRFSGFSIGGKAGSREEIE